MKTRISRILGVVLSITIILSMFALPTTVEAAPGDMQWFSESLPGKGTSFVMYNGSDVTDIAVADATTLYVANGAGGAGNRIYKSTNAGQSFSNLDTYAGGAPLSIAVAPDNVNAIAVTDGALVYVSNDAGTTWSTLPAFALAGTAMDIAVGPARSGTLLGREYFIALSDPAAGTALGDVQMIGATATWASAGSVTGIATTRDFTSVVVSPNFLGDRTVVAVGTGAAANSSALYLINTATKSVIVGGAAGTPLGLTTTIDVGGAAVPILATNISIPSNFDPTTSGGRRAYVAVATTPAAENDVYRVDNDTARSLGAGLGQVKSVAFAGTIDSGKLVAASNASSNVKFTDNPTVTSPTWTTTSKAPTGATATVVRTAADFSTTNRIFAGTTGAESALSISNDSGVSFAQETFIDNGAADNVVAVQNIELTPDGKVMFMTADDGADLSVWKANTPVTGTGWSRVFNIAGTTGILALNPDYGNTPAIFFADKVAAGSIYVSSNGGTTFATRMSPTGVTLNAMAAQDANIVYLLDNTNIYKSTNAAWTWGSPVPHKATGNGTSIVVPRFDDIIVGGTAGASYSTDGGANFTAINTGLSGQGGIYIAVDSKYSGNKTVYAGGNATGQVLRYVIGTSSQWDIQANPAGGGSVVAMEQKNGTLYAVLPATVDRSLEPTKPTGSVVWTTMNAGAAVAATTMATSFGDTSANYIYVSNGVTSLWSYKDYLAVAKPELTSPADKVTVDIDPVNGRGSPITIAFKKMGTGTGLVNTIDVEIQQKATGLTGVPTCAAQGVAPEAPSILMFSPTNAGGAFFRSNTEYVWAIRVANEVSADGVNSNWTTPRTFTVGSGGVVNAPQAGPQLQGPAGGATNVNPALVGFSWSPEPGAIEYTIIVASDAALTKTLGGTPAKVTSPAYQVANLDADTTYFWSVQQTKPVNGIQSIGTFHTAPKPAPTVAPTTPAPQPTPVIQLPPATTPTWAWAVIVIGAVLIIAIIILIVRTRRVP